LRIIPGGRSDTREARVPPKNGRGDNGDNGDDRQREFDLLWPPQTHTGDPPTSHEAEAREHASGSNSLQQRAVYDFVERVPGLMGTDIAAQITVLGAFHTNPVHRLMQVRKRLSHLRAKRLVDRQHTVGEREVRWYLWNQCPARAAPAQPKGKP
jgi:hypothetical protein